jgi:hypothetical protein
MTIRLCRDDDHEPIFAIINAAAEAYRGVIPKDCFHDPYMSKTELAAEIAAGRRDQAEEWQVVPMLRRCAIKYTE